MFFVEIYTHVKRSYFLQIQLLQSLIKVLFLWLKKRGHPVQSTQIHLSYFYGCKPYTQRLKPNAGTSGNQFGLYTCYLQFCRHSVIYKHILRTLFWLHLGKMPIYKTEGLLLYRSIPLWTSVCRTLGSLLKSEAKRMRTSTCQRPHSSHNLV